MESPASYYQERITEFTKELQGLQKRSLLVSTGRLISFIITVIAAYYWFRYHSGPGLVAGTIFLVLFIVLVRIALTLRDQKALASKMLFINTNEAAVLQQQPNGFSDGQGFGADSVYTADLDIFGPGSIFHLLNRTTTSHGTHSLAKALQQPLLSKQEIEAQQQAVKVLSTQTALRQLITANGLLQEEKEGTLHDILSWLKMPAVLVHRSWVRYLRILLPAYNVIAIIFYLYSDNYAPLLPGILLSWTIIGMFAKRIHQQHQLLGRKQAILTQYASILRLFTQAEAGESQVLQQQQIKAREAHKAISRLSALAGYFDQRLNLLVNIFLNSIFMYDIQCLWGLEGWKARNSRHFQEWIDCVGGIEQLVSLSTFAFNNPGNRYPVVQAGQPVIRTTGLAHPLIEPAERVPNDFTMGKEERLVLVTGSNMSGKTTFLRTVGVNLVLAQCGAPVCAESFHFTPMQILSSIRVSDSLQEHTSYFMAELKRLQQIVRFLQQEDQPPALILIDEILRGTNSEDKTHGSEQFIKKLLQYRCLTMFATHDLALSRLETELPGQLSNYCFESIIRQGELIFDYRLQRGVAKNKNASFLMEKMEII